MIFSSCNLVEWNQKHLTKKYNRKGIVASTFQTDEHKVHYFEGGEGDTVLLIHGFGGDAQVTWNKTIQDLAKDHHVIAPDLLWFGKSQSSATPNLDAQVDAISRLLENRKVKKCSVIGISYGGFVTLGLVYKHRELFEKMVIVDSPGLTYDISLLDGLAKKQNEERFQDIFVTKTPEDVGELFHLAAYKGKKIPKGILKDAFELYFNQNHKEMDQLLTTLPAEQQKFQNADTSNLPKSVLIWGQYDEIFPPSEGKKFANYLGVEYKEVPNAGHAVNIENFKDFQRILREFLAN